MKKLRHRQAWRLPKVTPWKWGPIRAWPSLNHTYITAITIPWKVFMQKASCLPSSRDKESQRGLDLPFRSFPSQLLSPYLSFLFICWLLPFWMYCLQRAVCAGQEGAQQICFQCLWSSGLTTSEAKLFTLSLICDFNRRTLCWKLPSWGCQWSGDVFLSICLRIFCWI